MLNIYPGQSCPIGEQTFWNQALKCQGKLLSFQFQCGNLLTEHQPLFILDFFFILAGRDLASSDGLLQSCQWSREGFYSSSGIHPQSCRFWVLLCLLLVVKPLCSWIPVVGEHRGREGYETEKQEPPITSKILIFYLFINHELHRTCQNSRCRALHHTIIFYFVYLAPFPPSQSLPCWCSIMQNNVGFPAHLCHLERGQFVLRFQAFLYSYPIPPPVCCSFRGAFRGAFPILFVEKQGLHLMQALEMLRKCRI